MEQECSAQNGEEKLGTFFAHAFSTYLNLDEELKVYQLALSPHRNILAIGTSTWAIL